MRILLVEDDLKILDYLSKGLTESGFNVDKAKDGMNAQEYLSAYNYDLLILDIMLPGVDGLTILKNIRNKRCNLPVIILSAKQNVEDRVKGLEVGADDYLTKPFSFSELLARVQALLRRSNVSSTNENNILEKGAVRLDIVARRVFRGQDELQIQGKEYLLLEFFMRNANKVLTKTQILEGVWNYQFNPQTNVVDVLVFRLRSKLDGDYDSKMIKTIRGVGYVFESD